MITLAAVVLITTAAALAAAFVQRRAGTRRPVQVGHEAPVQLHRADFVRPDAPWLVVAFTSATCETCQSVWAKCDALESSEVATENVEYRAQRELHERYAITAVPLVVVADRDGVVRRSFFGPVSASDLWSALADLRTPK